MPAKEEKEFIKCKVVQGKSYMQVFYKGIWYRIGSYSEQRVEPGKWYMFMLEESNGGERKFYWANLRKLDPNEPYPDDESVEPDDKGAGRRAAGASASLPVRNAGVTRAFELQTSKSLERIADALESIEQLLTVMIG